MLAGRTFQAAALAAVVLAVWVGALGVLGKATGAIAPGDRFNLPLWIAAHLSRAWLNPPARLLGGGTAPATDRQVVDFFGRSSGVAAAETDLAYAKASGGAVAPAEEELDRRLAGARSLSGAVQLRLSAELAAVAAGERLTTALPLYDRVRFVWPPVSFAYDLPPYLLIRSRRDKIETVGTTLLRNDLSSDEIGAIEKRAGATGDSALVVRIGGIATYPSLVEEDDTYAGGLDLVAHEWTHQYLAFHPLGVRYFESTRMATINETVANIVGHDLAAAVRVRYPLAGAPVHVPSSAPPPDPSVDFNRTMHQLRLDVDALLAQGKISEAEGRMDETQRFLVAHGYYVPAINQAYFAFYGTYANTAASSSPVGPKLARLRRNVASVSAFLHAVQTVRSPEDLDRLVSASGG